jgi:hypothetical protein
MIPWKSLAIAFASMLLPLAATAQTAQGLTQWKESDKTMAQFVAGGFKLVSVTSEDAKNRDGSYHVNTFYLQSGNHLVKCLETAFFEGTDGQRPSLGRTLTSHACALLVNLYSIPH